MSQQQQLVTNPKKVSESCFDYVHLEMVDSFYSFNERTEIAEAKLDRVGFLVGQKLAERYCVERTPFLERIDIIKFLCREIWINIFGKQVDSLKTNRKGVFVLTDHKFRWITHLSSDVTMKTKSLAEKYIFFPCGVIKGALDILGIQCSVKAEITAIPTCTFTIVVKNP